MCDFWQKNLNVDTLTSLTNTVCKLLDLFVWIFLYPMSCDQFSYLDCAQGWSLQNETKWPSWSSLHFFLDVKLIHHIMCHVTSFHTWIVHKVEVCRMRLNGHLDLLFTFFWTLSLYITLSTPIGWSPFSRNLSDSLFTESWICPSACLSSGDQI